MLKIKLRALTIEDMQNTLEWHNQEDISDLYSGHPFPVNAEMERRWYDKNELQLMQYFSFFCPVFGEGKKKEKYLC